LILFLVVYGKEDNIEADVDVDDEEEQEPVLRPDETITPATDILVRQKNKIMN
jgi:hypothetical protein